MKNYILILFTLLCCNSYAQNMTLDELLSLRDKGLGQVEEYLTKKGWEYLQGEEGDFGELDSATFSYFRSEFNNKADSFITYFYSDLSETKRIQIQINLVEVYNEFLNKIKSYGCKLIDSKVEKGNLIKYYQGKTTTFQIIIGTMTDDFGVKQSVYSIKLISNQDYKTNFINY